MEILTNETSLLPCLADDKEDNDCDDDDDDAGKYFNKIQCFCFEEQRLAPHEEIDMPVFFFIDPDITRDPSMESCSSITLSYTFFKTDEDDDSEVRRLLLQNQQQQAQAEAVQLAKQQARQRAQEEAAAAEAAAAEKEAGKRRSASS